MKKVKTLNFKRFLLLWYFTYLCRKVTDLIPKIKIEDFTYPLPQERIAKFPLEKRDSSKLLVYKDGQVLDDKFCNIAYHIPEGTFLVRNNTKVVPARLFFRKNSGAIIEILSLSPVEPKDYVLSFASVGSCCWRAVVGNLKKWKGSDIEFFSDDQNLKLKLGLKAELVERGAECVVKFKWNPPYTFSEVLEECGKVPIPPYLNRESEAIDKTRYQTVYALSEGSIAAPTAGLHFTPEVFNSLKKKNIEIEDICLHVGAGTFKPVKSEYIADHNMHLEPFSVSKEFLQKLLKVKEEKRPLLSVGTTSTRTLESLYYIGVECIESGRVESVKQWAPYTKEYKYTLKEALEGILEYLDKNGLNRLVSGTSIIIVPGFDLKVADIQLTNFHQPQSTLLLLIAAIVGDSWKQIYAHALDNGYRFLSYGDSSLLFNSK